MGKILAIDLGTTYFKFSLFDDRGRLGEMCRIAPPVERDSTGRVELPVDGFCQAILRGLSELRSVANGCLDDVAAVTFATQTNSFVLLDAADRPLTPLILWQDARAAQLTPEVRARCDIPGFQATTGLHPIDFQYMPAKLLWLQRESPETWKRSRRLCLMSDYLTFLMTGRHVTESGAAGLTGLVDIHRCGWYPEMLDTFEIDSRQLPAIVRAGTDLGTIATKAADRFGLPTTCRFVVGCLDQYAGAIGVGNVEPGRISETTGTVLASVRCSDRFTAQPDTGVYQGPAFHAGWYWQMAVGQISANYLHWYRDCMPERPDFDRLTSLAESVEPGSAGLRLRGDVAMTHPSTVFEGLTDLHTDGHKVRCIMEAVACALDEQVAALAGGHRPAEIVCAGGAARSCAWLQIKADVLGLATTATDCAEPTSLGAAVLAKASLEATEVPRVARQWVHLKPPQRPNLERHRQYRQLQSALCRIN